MNKLHQNIALFLTEKERYQASKVNSRFREMVVDFQKSYEYKQEIYKRLDRAIVFNIILEIKVVIFQDFYRISNILFKFINDRKIRMVILNFNFGCFRYPPSLDEKKVVVDYLEENEIYYL